MKEKRKDCLYCGKEMLEVKTIRKKFCSDLCRVNFNHEVKYEKEIRKVLDNPIFNKLKRDVIFNLMVYGQSSIPKELAINNLPENRGSILNERNTPHNLGKKHNNPIEIKNALNIPEAKKENKVDNSLGKHRLWKEGDPKENSMAFSLKYGCMTYDELENKK